MAIPSFVLGLIVGIIEIIILEGSVMMDEATLFWLELFNVLIYFVSFLIGLFYFAGMHASKWQATIGKRLVGIKVIDTSGNRISFGKSFGRYLATILSAIILYIGFIMAGFSSKKQALHDKIAGTLVIKKA